MKYMGSKSRHAWDIYTAISGSTLRSYAAWVEPFVGGANMICEVPHTVRRIGNDLNFYVIAMFRALQMGWIPPTEVSETEYKRLREKSVAGVIDDEACLIGFAGVGCSYAGKFFGGYARGNQSNGKPRNYCLESRRNVLSQIKKLSGVEFRCGDYTTLDIPVNSLVYCDPPYFDSTKYKTDFSHKDFWRWCEILSAKHQVFVSEYTAPDGWVSIWSKRVNSSLTKNTGAKTGTENLFVYRGSNASLLRH